MLLLIMIINLHSTSNIHRRAMPIVHIGTVSWPHVKDNKGAKTRTEEKKKIMGKKKKWKRTSPAVPRYCCK